MSSRKNSDGAGGGGMVGPYFDPSALRISGIRVERLSVSGETRAQRSAQAAAAAASRRQDNEETSEVLTRATSAGKVTPRRVQHKKNSISAQSSPVQSPREAVCRRRSITLSGHIPVPARGALATKPQSKPDRLLLTREEMHMRANSDGKTAALRRKANAEAFAEQVAHLQTDPLRRAASSGAGTPVRERSNSSYSGGGCGSAGADRSLLKAVASSFSLSQSSKEFILILLQHDPMGRSYSHREFLIPVSEVGEEHRYVFAAASLGTGMDFVDDEIIALRKQAVGLLASEEQLRDIGYTGDPRTNSLFAKYGKQAGEHRAEKKKRVIEDWFLVVWPF